MVVPQNRQPLGAEIEPWVRVRQHRMAMRLLAGLAVARRGVVRAPLIWFEEQRWFGFDLDASSIHFADARHP